MIAMRENLAAKVRELPDIYLEELAAFLEFLFWKAELTKPIVEMPAIEDDPLIGLFAGDADLAEKSEEMLENNPRFLQILDEARQRVHTTGGLSLAEFRQKSAERYTSHEEESVNTET